MPAPSPGREREKQGVVNLSTPFSFEALILKPLMVTSPPLSYNWLLSHCRLRFTLPSLTPCSLWPPLQFTNSDSRVPSSPYREETASSCSSKLLGKGPSFHKPQNIIVWIKMFTCYQPYSYSDVYFWKILHLESGKPSRAFLYLGISVDTRVFWDHSLLKSEQIICTNRHIKLP